MKLLLDENLSHRLIPALHAHFPGSTHVRLIGLARASDSDIWEFARGNGFAIVSMDADFYDLSVLRGPPPKVIWLQAGNTSTSFVQDLLIRRSDMLREFASHPDEGCLILDATR